MADIKAIILEIFAEPEPNLQLLKAYFRTFAPIDDDDEYLCNVLISKPDSYIDILVKGKIRLHGNHNFFIKYENVLFSKAFDNASLVLLDVYLALGRQIESLWKRAVTAPNPINSREEFIIGLKQRCPSIDLNDESDWSQCSEFALEVARWQLGLYTESVKKWALDAVKKYRDGSLIRNLDRIDTIVKAVDAIDRCTDHMPWHNLDKGIGHLNDEIHFIAWVLEHYNWRDLLPVVEGRKHRNAILEWILVAVNSDQYNRAEFEDKHLNWEDVDYFKRAWHCK